MELIKVARVENVQLLHQGIPSAGTLHITPHHLIFSHAPPRRSRSANHDEDNLEKPAPKTREVWITYPIISTVERKYMGHYGGIDKTNKEQDEGSATYSSESGVRKQQALAIRLRCRDFSFITLVFEKEKSARDVFDSIKNLTCRDSVEKLYAFSYKPGKPERLQNGWNLYNALTEFERQGLSSDWRLSKINVNYTFCETYPQHLYVPSTITDNTLGYAGKYRSRQRAPVLTYFHNVNNCTITRCSQPLVGVRGNRSIQDEKLVAAIFTSSNASSFLNFTPVKSSSSSTSLASMDSESVDSSISRTSTRQIYGAQQTNLIVDARPIVNAVAQQAVGAGSENMDHYKFAKKEYLGIDNIHVMRDSLAKVIEAIKDSDITPFPANRDMLAKSNWLKHISGLMEGTNIITRQVGLEHSHVLIHCSDGWDRTSQFSALSQICLDPFFRTLEGFMVLVEKDWVSFGHKFVDRCGFLSSEKWFLQGSDSSGSTSSGVTGLEQALGAAKLFFNNHSNNLRATATSESAECSEPELLDTSSIKKGKGQRLHETKVKETSPVFHQFLDATYQLLQQNTNRFEFNERFLRRLLYHLYSCQYGTFLYNSEKERKQADINKKTRSVWDYFLARREMWINPEYEKTLDDDERGVGGRIIFPDSRRVTWWWEAFGRKDEEMNGRKEQSLSEGVVDPVKRDGVTEIVEDNTGHLTSPQHQTSPSLAKGHEDTDESLLQSAAVLGTEKAANLANYQSSSTSLTTMDTIGTVEESTFLNTAHSDKPWRKNEQDSEELPISSLPSDSTPLQPASSLPKNIDSSISNSPVIVPFPPSSPSPANVDFPSDSDQDPLGGHAIVDLGVSLSPRRTGRTLGVDRTIHSRSRSRGSNASENAAAVSEEKPSKSQMEVFEMS